MRRMRRIGSVVVTNSGDRAEVNALGHPLAIPVPRCHKEMLVHWQLRWLCTPDAGEAQCGNATTQMQSIWPGMRANGSRSG